MITNAHVLYEADNYTLKDVNENEYEGETIYTDTSNDIAIIEINNFEGKSVTFGNSDEISIGDEVLLIGNPANGINNACYIGDLSEYEFDHLSFIIPINRVKQIIERNTK